MWLLRWNISLRKKRFLKIIDRGPYLVGFPAMQIMNLWGMFFHPANVSSLTFALEVKSCSALCGQGRKLPKHYVKFPIFSSIACINVGIFSIRFSYEIFSGFGDSSCWNLNFCFSLLKLTFLYFQSWRLATQEPLIILEPKLMEKLPTLMQAIEEKLGNFT